MVEESQPLGNIVEDMLASLNEAKNKTNNAGSVEEMKNIADNFKSKISGWESRVKQSR